jgi:hypothetical protein
MTLNQQLHIQREINKERMRFEKHRTSHFKHAVAAFLTLGAWLPGWVFIGLYNAKIRRISVERSFGLDTALALGEVE